MPISSDYMGVETNGKTSYSPGFSRRATFMQRSKHQPHKERLINDETIQAVIAGAAVAGLLTGSFAVRAYAASTSDHAGFALQTMADAE